MEINYLRRFATSNIQRYKTARYVFKRVLKTLHFLDHRNIRCHKKFRRYPTSERTQ